MKSTKTVFSAALVAAALAFSGCGPSLTEVRKYVLVSPHRKLAVFTVDFRKGQKDVSARVTSVLENKLRRDGFALTDHKRTLLAYQDSTLRQQAFQENSQAQDIAKSLGAKAVLTGSIEDDYERVDKHPPIFRFDPVASPACCSATPACPGQLVQDPETGWVNSCGQRHRKVLVEAARSSKIAAIALKLKLFDTQTRALLWEGRYETPQNDATLENAADVAVESLTDQIADAFIKRGL